MIPEQDCLCSIGEGTIHQMMGNPGGRVWIETMDKGLAVSIMV
jgi:hypothetical protein